MTSKTLISKLSKHGIIPMKVYAADDFQDETVKLTAEISIQLSQNGLLIVSYKNNKSRTIKTSHLIKDILKGLKRVNS